MLAYYLLLGIPLLLEIIASFYGSNGLVIISQERRIKSEKRIIAVFFFIFFLLLAFRSTKIGSDLNAYEFFFSKVKNMEWSSVLEESPEIFYTILNKIISSAGGGFRTLLVVVAIITVLPFAILYYKECENSLLTISIFINISIFSMIFSGLRQAIAFSLGIIAFYCVKNKKRLAFLLCVLVAYLFHNSAFILLALYPIYHTKITKKSFKFIVPLMGIIFIFRDRVFLFALKFLSEDYQDKYSNIKSNGAFTILILFILFTTYSFMIIEDEKIEKSTMGLRNILVVATCLQIFASINTIAMRMNYYFIPFIPAIISKITAGKGNDDEKNIVKIINSVLIIFFIIYFLYNAKTGEDILQIFPYKPYWSE